MHPFLMDKTLLDCYDERTVMRKTLPAYENSLRKSRCDVEEPYGKRIV